jgi:predicted  nucleic acid-binding Zn-ribbon protein
MKIEVSNGELFDKLTILEIKLSKITDKDKLDNLMAEWEYINSQAISYYQIYGNKLTSIVDKLDDLNNELWWVEDNIRLCEKEQRFDKEFVELARSVYKLNDERHAIKKDIDKLTNSKFSEEKSYSK